MKIKSIRKTGPELYLVTFKKWWSSREFERYVILDIFSNDEGVEICLVAYRDSDELAHDCSAHVEWMVRNDVEFFDNFPEKLRHGYSPITLICPSSSSDPRPPEKI